MEITPFVIVDHLTQKTEMNYEDVMDAYNPYVINVALSNTMKTVFYAAEMNKYPALTNEQQYTFYLHGLPQRKIYGKWNKKLVPNLELIDIVVDQFKCSRKTAEQYVAKMSQNQKQHFLDMRGMS